MKQFDRFLFFAIAAAFAANANAADPDVPALPMTRLPPALHLIEPIRQGAGMMPVEARSGRTGMIIHATPLACCDFVGNGKGGLALFDGFTGCWYGFGPNAEPLFFGVPWGWPGSIPVPGDYDGDRTADLAVFEPETGLWAVRAVGGNVLLWEQPWGWPGCVPVPGDYDGDNRSDLAFFDPATARWYIRTSSGIVLFWAFAWGWPAQPGRSAAIPVAGDYNGDGRSDLIVKDAGTGRIYVREIDGKIPAWDEKPDDRQR